MGLILPNFILFCKYRTEFVLYCFSYLCHCLFCGLGKSCLHFSVKLVILPFLGDHSHSWQPPPPPSWRSFRFAKLLQFFNSNFSIILCSCSIKDPIRSSTVTVIRSPDSSMTVTMYSNLMANVLRTFSLTYKSVIFSPLAFIWFTWLSIRVK